MFKFGGTDSGPANFVPFKTIVSYLLDKHGLVVAIFNLAGNIGLLVPFGFLVPLVSEKITWQKTLALAVVFCSLIELLQGILHTGIVDIDDVILNGLGIMIGYWFCLLLVIWMRYRAK